MGGGWLEGGSGPGESTFDIERDLLCTADAEGRFTALNAAWEHLLGWSREELMAEPFVSFVHPEDMERTIEASSKVVTADYELTEFENRYRTKDGDWRWLRWSARSDGEMWFAVAWDVTERKQAEQRLRSALRAERLAAYCQPIVDRRGVAGQQELLARLLAEDGGDVLMPSEFLPAAERSGLVRSIDHWMALQAIALAAAGRPSEVNLSAVSIGDEGLTDEIAEAVEAAPECAGRIVFEITETAALEQFDAACRFAERLGACGCSFALDDFGTGFGGFTYLRRLPIRYLKIDTSFVRELARSKGDQALVRSIVAIAGELGQETVAEGVEDGETLEMLRDFGVDHAQGYFLGRPRPLEEPLAAR